MKDSAEKLEHSGPAKWKRVASASQSKQLAGMPLSAMPKEKGTKPFAPRSQDR